MSEEPILEDAEQTTQPSKGNPSVAKQKSIEDTDVTINAPESLKLDTVLQDSFHKYVLMQMNSINKLQHRKMLHKIQTPSVMIGNIQLKTLPESLL